jgi:cytochrome b561
LLYVLMIGAPIGGMAIWFGGIESLGDGHGAAATFLVILASGHAIMALWHHFVRKDGLLGRMTRPGD